MKVAWIKLRLRHYNVGGDNNRQNDGDGNRDGIDKWKVQVQHRNVTLPAIRTIASPQYQQVTYFSLFCSLFIFLSYEWLLFQHPSMDERERREINSSTMGFEEVQLQTSQFCPKLFFFNSESDLNQMARSIFHPGLVACLDPPIMSFLMRSIGSIETLCTQQDLVPILVGVVFGLIGKRQLAD